MILERSRTCRTVQPFGGREWRSYRSEYLAIVILETHSVSASTVAGVRSMGAQVSVVFPRRIARSNCFIDQNRKLLGDPWGNPRAKLVKEVAKQRRNFVEVCAPPDTSFAQCADCTIFRKWNPPILQTRTGKYRAVPRPHRCVLNRMLTSVGPLPRHPTRVNGACPRSLKTITRIVRQPGRTHRSCT